MKRKTPMLCTPVSLPPKEWAEAARVAIEINPVNRPPVELAASLFSVALVCDDGSDKSAPPRPDFLAVLTTKYWGQGGVKLSVGFLDNAPADLRTRILAHMNAWGKHCNVSFAESGQARTAQVRINRGRGGYWSYLGTDITRIKAGEPTMNLEGFTMNTPEAEFVRVVRHETGHTLGFPHEHLRRDIVARIDQSKAVAYFKQTQGWDADTTTSQVLTPIDERALLTPTPADETSIMAYQLPGQIMRDGRPVIGGKDINATDAAYAAKVYPKAVVVEPPAPPPPEEGGAPESIALLIKGKGLRITANGKPVTL